MSNTPVSNDRLVKMLETAIKKNMAKMSQWEMTFANSILSIYSNTRMLTGKQRRKVQEIILKLMKPEQQKAPPTQTPDLFRERPAPQSKSDVVRRPEINLQLINAKEDVAKLAKQINRAGCRKGATFLFYGPPGTGKSIYGKYIAEMIGLPARPIFGSDILGAYVGESEGNIKRHFEEAREKGEVLIFDEVDSLLISRSRAKRSHEISTVNEFLTQIEHHSLPLICTTNFMENLDRAVLRRLMFKVEFGYMCQEQTSHAWDWFFGSAVPKELAKINCLTAADFDVVKRKADILGLLDDFDELVVMLKWESSLKPDTQEKEKWPIGFQP
jgi:transitional endoplasmic reticulum ATPase